MTDLFDFFVKCRVGIITFTLVNFFRDCSMKENDC